MYSWDESSAKESDELNPDGRFPHVRYNFVYVVLLALFVYQFGCLFFSVCLEMCVGHCQSTRTCIRSPPTHLLAVYFIFAPASHVGAQGLAWLHDQLGGTEGMGNFIQHMGKWRADTHYVAEKAWDWTVDDRGKNNVWSTAWTDSAAFHEELFGNATKWFVFVCLFVCFLLVCLFVLCGWWVAVGAMWWWWLW
jgi:hypothetical protein